MTNVSGEPATNPTDKQAVTSDDAKSPWDVVKEIDWGNQLDEMKAGVEEKKATSTSTSDTSASSDKPAAAPAKSTSTSTSSTSSS
jgi:hypothetical protein